MRRTLRGAGFLGLRQCVLIGQRLERLMRQLASRVSRQAGHQEQRAREKYRVDA
jgi:hypothetical protein